MAQKRKSTGKAASKGTKKAAAAKRVGKKAVARRSAANAAVVKRTTKATAKKRTQKTPARDAGKPMIVIASGERPLTDVTKDLEAAGFQVGEVLHAIGQVTGTAKPGLQTRLRSIQGVADVSEAHQDFNIGPPDAPVS